MSPPAYLRYSVKNKINFSYVSGLVMYMSVIDSDNESFLVILIISQFVTLLHNNMTFP